MEARIYDNTQRMNQQHYAWFKQEDKKDSGMFLHLHEIARNHVDVMDRLRHWDDQDSVLEELGELASAMKRFKENASTFRYIIARVVRDIVEVLGEKERQEYIVKVDIQSFLDPGYVQYYLFNKDEERMEWKMSSPMRRYEGRFPSSWLDLDREAIAKSVRH